MRIDAMKPYRFENAPLIAAFLNRPGSGNGLDRCRVNGRRNRIENDAVTNETAFVQTLSETNKIVIRDK